MVKCSGESDNPTKFCNTGDSDSRVHFKNTRVTTRATSMLLLTMARGYLEDALVREQTMPFTHFCRGIPSMVNMVELTAHFPFDLFLSHLVVLAVRDMHQTVAIGLTQCMKKMTDIEPSTRWFSFQFSFFQFQRQVYHFGL